MRKFKLKIFISPSANIVINGEIKIGDFIFSSREGKGTIETFVSEIEKDRKIEEVKNFLSLISLEKSEEIDSNFFIYPGEIQFFNVETYGITRNYKKINLNLAIGEEETCITENFIKRIFKKYEIISSNEKLVRSLRWYNLGKYSKEVGDSFICFVTCLEAIFEDGESKSLKKESEIKQIEDCISNLKIDKKLKERILNCIGTVKNPSFKEKTQALFSFLNEEVQKVLLEEAQKNGLIEERENLEDFFGEIYKDRGKILHSGLISVENVSLKCKWLELFTRKLLISKINSLCQPSEKK